MATDSWVIQVNDKISPKTSTDNTLAEVDRWKRRCIYKLPASVTKLKRIHYRPKVVSFGPYHRNHEYVKPMEEHKDRALIQFLKRSKILDVQVFYDALDKVVHDLMAAYDSLDHELQNDKNGFLKLMIRDGCFMIEVMRMCTDYSVNDYPANDPIFSDHGKLYVMPCIKRDMFLLENQLPMLVFHKLLQLENALPKEDEKLANTLVSRFLFSKSSTGSPTNCLHVLDLYRRSMLEPNRRCKKSQSYDIRYMIPKGGDDIIRSAFELDEAGIRIRKSKLAFLKDISFENGILRLPMITVDETTEPLFLNLIAFERFHVGAGNDVTSYVYFMGSIIDDARDISLLHTKDIIQNAIGSNKAVAKLFNSFSNDVSLDEISDLGLVYKEVNDYCKKRWPRWRSYLKHIRRSSPWAFLSVAAAILLFALTIAQTGYTVAGYYRPNGS